MLPLANSIALDKNCLGDLSPDKILFDFDGPRTFTAMDPQGQMLLLHQCNQDDNSWSYFVVPFSRSRLEDLESGRIDLKSALDQPRLWFVAFGKSGIESVHLIQDHDSFKDFLPLPGTMLYPELEPLLSIRSLGESVHLGQTTLGVLRSSIDNVRTSLRTLAEFAMGETGKRGQPSSKTRKYYDLPATILAGSVQVLALPESTSQKRPFEEDEIWQRMEELLKKGFEEARKTTALSTDDPLDDEELRVAIKAVYQLAPPVHGPVDTVEVAGRLAPFTKDGKPLQITKHTRSSLGQRMRSETTDLADVIKKTGYIGEVDRDETSCLLRDLEGNLILKLSFDDEHFDLVFEALETRKLVEVIAITVPSSAIADLITITFVTEKV